MKIIFYSLGRKFGLDLWGFATQRYSYVVSFDPKVTDFPWHASWTTRLTRTAMATPMGRYATRDDAERAVIAKMKELGL